MNGLIIRVAPKKLSGRMQIDRSVNRQAIINVCFFSLTSHSFIDTHPATPAIIAVAV